MMLAEQFFTPHFQAFPMSSRKSWVVKKRCSTTRLHCLLNHSPSSPFGYKEVLPLYNRVGGATPFLPDHSFRDQPCSVSTYNSSTRPEISFDRLQLSEQEFCKGYTCVFGRFMARGAVLDEEYWTAAWLRAEAQWESVSYMRHVESYKKKYAEQEFYALKDRCLGRDGSLSKCICLVAVKKKESNVTRTVLNSVVGTLDLSIRPFFRGETNPGESKKSVTAHASHDSYDTRKYAYISNLCVSKCARRQGIASNMLHLATDMAISAGMTHLFVHVHLDNFPAQELYKRIGFKFVGTSMPSKDQRFLMFMEL